MVAPGAAAALARHGRHLSALVRTNVPLCFAISTLLRQNLLRQLLRRPGARGAARLAGRGRQPLPRRRGRGADLSTWINDSGGLICSPSSPLVIMVQHQRPRSRWSCSCRWSAVIAAGSTRPRGRIGALSARQPPGRRRGHRLPGRDVRRGAGGEGGRGRGAGDRPLPQPQRRAPQGGAARTACSTQMLDSRSFGTSVNLGTGVILLLAGQAMRAGTFTVGDFALFVYYLAASPISPRLIGLHAGALQAGRRVGRAHGRACCQGAPAAALVEHSPIYVHGDAARRPAARRTPADRLRRWKCAG